MNELSLFSGYGGFSLGLRLAGVEVTTIGYVEQDAYCQQILSQRMEDGYLDTAPIVRDITTTDFRPMAGLVDIITAGFPCQPHSSAGKRLGKKDSRNLWPDTLRVIREVGPHYVLLENVRGLADGANPYSAEILGQLSEVGMDAVWGLHSAAEAGAPHLRWRWWCLAYTNSPTFPQQQGRKRYVRSTGREGEVNVGRNGEDGDVADNDGERCGTSRKDNRQWRADALIGSSVYVANATERTEGLIQGSSRRPGPGEVGGAYSESGRDNSWWAVEPDVGRVADGVAARVDRLRALGNGIVPAVVREFLS